MHHRCKRPLWTASMLVVVATLARRPAAGQQPTPDIRDTVPACAGPCATGPRLGLVAIAPVVVQDTGRRKAIQYSASYATRMTVHRIGSYAELPLFAAEYFVGEKLLSDERNDPTGRSSVKGVHGALAAGLGALFTVNTVTGVWALVESRHDPAGRTRRWIHSIAMLVADGGFLATAAAAQSAVDHPSAADHHRALAIGSIGVATVATAIMWFWKD